MRLADQDLRNLSVKTDGVSCQGEAERNRSPAPLLQAQEFETEAGRPLFRRPALIQKFAVLLHQLYARQLVYR
jgi:hypothetical protein